VHRLVAAVERLEAFPQSGRVVPERNDEAIREVIVRPYRIVYRDGIQGLASLSGNYVIEGAAERTVFDAS
jgi:plasmid stabilization system protein ParE